MNVDQLDCLLFAYSTPKVWADIGHRVLRQGMVLGEGADHSQHPHMQLHRVATVMQRACMAPSTSTLTWCRNKSQQGASCHRSRPSPKRQKREPHVKDEEGGPNTWLLSTIEDEGDVAGGQLEQEDYEEERHMQAKHGVQLQGLRCCVL